MEKLANKIIKMNVALLYLITTVLYVAWCFTIGHIYDTYGVAYSQYVYGNIINHPEILVYNFVFPFIEEIISRWIPLFLFFSVFNLLSKNSIKIEKKKKFEKYGVLIIVLISSSIFGYLHGNWYNIPLQGVLGLLLSMFYLRTYYRRRLAGKKCYLQIYPLLSSTLYHIFTNGIWYCIDNVPFGLGIWHSAGLSIWSGKDLTFRLFLGKI